MDNLKIKEGYTLLRDFTYGLDFTCFNDDEHEEVEIFETQQDAEESLNDLNMSIFSAIKDGMMDDYDFSEVSVYKVVEFKDKYIAYDNKGKELLTKNK